MRLKRGEEFGTAAHRPGLQQGKGVELGRLDSFSDFSCAVLLRLCLATSLLMTISKDPRVNFQRTWIQLRVF